MDKGGFLWLFVANAWIKMGREGWKKVGKGSVLSGTSL